MTALDLLKKLVCVKFQSGEEFRQDAKDLKVDWKTVAGILYPDNSHLEAALNANLERLDDEGFIHMYNRPSRDRHGERGRYRAAY